MSLALQWAALLVVATLSTLAIWLASARTPELLVVLLAAALPATIAFGVLLYRHQRSSRIARRAVESLEARASGFLESAMDPIVAIDEDQRVIQFNAGGRARVPVAARRGDRQSIDMLLPPRFRAAHGEHIRRFASTGVTSRRMGDMRALAALRANGEEFPIDASISQHVENGRKVLTAILRDVTEREGAKSRLATSEGRLRGILDSAMDAVITVDEQQKIVLFNDAAQAMFGCPRDQAIGAPLAWFIPERFRQDHAAHVEQFGATGVIARRHGRRARRHGPAPQRRGVPDRRVDLAAARGRRQALHGDPARRQRARPRARELRSRARSCASSRAPPAPRARTRRPDRARAARRDRAVDVGAQDGHRLVRGSPAGADPALAKRLDRMEAQIIQTIASMRRIAADLRPLSLDDLGLVAAVETLAQSFERRSGVRRPPRGRRARPALPPCSPPRSTASSRNR
jgi:PAS domain S-box-containing protein